jgi:hypothetical protein
MSHKIRNHASEVPAGDLSLMGVGSGPCVAGLLKIRHRLNSHQSELQLYAPVLALAMVLTPASEAAAPPSDGRNINLSVFISERLCAQAGACHDELAKSGIEAGFMGPMLLTILGGLLILAARRRNRTSGSSRPTPTPHQPGESIRP